MKESGYIMNKLDLHGMSHSDALLAVENFVMVKAVDEFFSCKIITGNSLGMQSKVINEFLKPNNFKWYIPSWNLGEIIVSY